MSGNIFASSTVPGINDRDRDKQVVSLFKQPYYLSRTDNTTAYWVKLMIGSTLLMLVIPIYLAHLFLAVIRQPQPDSDVLLSRFYPLALRPDQGVETDSFRLAEIPISAVLTQALAMANSTRSHGLLAHALLELQNPELTSFAGLGYGVHLKEMNRGARLETFPGGMVPMCGAGGRYDEWGRVRALRYAYQWIVTGEQSSLMAQDGEDAIGSGVDVESLLMGWPALLLERARVSDPLNPVPPGSRRNVYGEAVDRVVGELCAHGRCNWAHETGMASEINNIEGGEIVKGGDENAKEQMILQDRSERSMRPIDDVLADPMESVFVLPSFLALYTVARQESKWLVGAVEQIRAQFDQLPVGSYQEKSVYQTTTTADSLASGSSTDAQQGYKWQRGNDAWIWAGIVRVLSVLEKWKPNLENSTVEEKLAHENWKDRAIHDLKNMINTFLVALRDNQKDTDDILRTCGSDTNKKICRSSPKDPARTALIVSSVYRLAQLGMLEDLGLLRWMDTLYNTVARSVGRGGEMSVLSDDMSEDDRHTDHTVSGDQNMVIMMWAARRDCAKAGVCRIYKRPSLWNRLRGRL